MAFTILTGKTLATAIEGRAKAVATFTEREHQLAYSALHHVELHNDPKYLDALYAVTPVNYRKGLRSWAGAFGKVKFDDATGKFEFVKGKTSKMDDALAIAPANYEKATKGKDKSDFDEVEFLTRALKKLTDNGGSPMSIRAIEGAIRSLKISVIETSREDKPARKAKAKVETAPEAQAA